MWFEKRGIVAKISGKNCIVLTPQGTYIRISRPSCETRVGEEVAYRGYNLAAAVKPMLLVASLLVAFLVYPALQQLLFPQATAYVSLDFQHGVEMAVDENNRVIGVKGFSDEASALVAPLDLKGRDLNDAAAAVIDKAIALNYIGPGQNNYVVSTIATPDSAPAATIINQNQLHQVMEERISRHGYSGQVKIYAVSEEFRLAAEKQRLTTGQYLIYEQLVAAGHKPAIEDINGRSPGQLAAAYNIDGVAPQNADNSSSSGEISIAKDGRTDSSVSRGYTGPASRNTRVPVDRVTPASFPS